MYASGSINALRTSTSLIATTSPFRSFDLTVVTDNELYVYESCRSLILKFRPFVCWFLFYCSATVISIPLYVLSFINEVNNFRSCLSLIIHKRLSTV